MQISHNSGINNILIFPFFILFSQGFLWGHGSHGVSGNDHTHSNSNLEFLSHYEGDFTDTDEDGMTDVYELKYGYDPNSADSFPSIDFVSESAETGTPIQAYEFMGLQVVPSYLGTGITLKWTDVSGDFYTSKYSLTLKNGEQTLYRGGHGWDYAELYYASFSLEGTEVLEGYFTEYDPTNGTFVKTHPQFTVDLNDHPVVNPVFGESSNQIKFKFTNFSDEQESKYLDFMRRVIPIIKDILGVPSESFNCEFIMQDEEGDSWVTMNHGRQIYLDSYWNPRLLVHEMIHMWEGQLGYGWSGPNREYADELSGFAEVAEGLAYKILHEYVMAYPTHYVSEETALGGPWNNWTSDAWSYDLYKHQEFTGGGTYWTGDLRTVNHRYSIGGMLIQIILVQNPEFMKSTRKELFEIMNQSPFKIMQRDEIVDLWSRHIPTINGIDTKAYLNAMPLLNGRKLDQGFYPVVNIRNQTEVDIFSSYVTDGLFWWSFVVPDDSSMVEFGAIPISSLEVPSWVKYNFNPDDGYLYLDMNDMPYTLSVKNLQNETVTSLDLRSENTYQDEEKIIAGTFGEIRVTDQYEVSPEDFSQGLYRYNVKYTDILEYTDEASKDFYFMGEKNLTQYEDEIILMFGIDSLFAEKVTLSAENFSFDLDVVNGCAILKTSSIPLNKEMMLSLTVSSEEETKTYTRSLVHAGNSWGRYRQQFLIIDRDFDGVEDLYDNEISESDIQTRYATYREKYPTSSLPSNNVSTSDGNEDETGNENNSTGGNGSATENHEGIDKNETSSTTQYELVSIIPSKGGGISGGGRFTRGEIVLLTAQPDPGYAFQSWSGDLNGSRNPFSFEVRSTLTVSANFIPSANKHFDEKLFRVDVSSGVGGSVIGQGDYSNGSTIFINAYPKDGYSFAGWSGDVSGTENPLSITVQKNLRIQALFEMPKFEPEKDVFDGGIVLKWDNNQSAEYTSYSRYSLTLIDGNRTLYYGGHNWDYAEVDFETFSLMGHETLMGRFSEYSPLDGEFIKDFDWFTIDLSEREDSNSSINGDEDSSDSNSSKTDQFNDLGNGWKGSNWFGSFFETSSPWVYHLELDWIYTDFESNGSVWFWHEKLGWCWSAETCYPFVFQDGKGWLYFDFTNSSDAIFYDFSARKWSEF